MSKRCRICNVIKQSAEFSKESRAKDGLRSWCKQCLSIRRKKWKSGPLKRHQNNASKREFRKTMEGWFEVAWFGMRWRCKRRNHPYPEFTGRDDFKKWAIDNGFHALWHNFLLSGKDRMLRPSIDRIDNSKSYTRDNIRLVTLGENLSRAYSDRASCRGLRPGRRPLAIGTEPNGPLKDLMISF